MNTEEAARFFAGDRYATEQTGIEILECAPGRARCRMAITPQHLNKMGTVMGGAIFTLADLAAAAAVNEPDRPSVAQSASISFLSPGTGSALEAEAAVVKPGRAVSVLEVRVTAGERLVAVAIFNSYHKNS